MVLVSWALTNGQAFQSDFIGTETRLTLQPLLEENVLVCWILQAVA